MKRILLTLLAFCAITMPALAAHPTPQQILQFIHDTSCSHGGNSITCTNKTPGTDTRRLPDNVKVFPDVPSHSTGITITDRASKCGVGFWEPNAEALGICNQNLYEQTNRGNGSRGGNLVTPGGSAVVPTCTTTSATLSYSGGNPLNPNNYDLSTSGPSKSDGAC